MSVLSPLCVLDAYFTVGQAWRVRLRNRGMERVGVNGYCSCRALKKSLFESPPSPVLLPNPKKRKDSIPEA